MRLGDEWWAINCQVVLSCAVLVRLWCDFLCISVRLFATLSHGCNFILCWLTRCCALEKLLKHANSDTSFRPCLGKKQTQTDNCSGPAAHSKDNPDVEDLSQKNVTSLNGGRLFAALSHDALRPEKCQFDSMSRNE